MTLANVITVDQASWEQFARKFTYAPSGCWEWRGSKSGKKQSYGRFGPKKGGMAAHRFAYLALIGPLAPGLVLDHLCRNEGCVNPWHCEGVSDYENFRRGVNKNALKREQTHCKRGHELVEGNLRPTRPGKNGVPPNRQCLTCHRGYWERKRLGLP